MKHAIWMLVIAAAMAAGCSQQEVRSFEGHAEAEYVRVAVPLSGSLAHLNVHRGAAVREGEMLFSLDDRKELAAHRIAEDRLQHARTRLEEAQRRPQQPSAIESAEAALNALQAELSQIGWRLRQKSVKAPKGGVIVDTLYDEGEWVPAGSAVVSMLSPETMKVRFYVPPQVVGSLRHGQTVRLRCEGCELEMAAQIVYVSSIAEQNAGQGANVDLRFLVEVRPAGEAGVQLRPGSMVEVVL
ncbi:MAG TPA: HlyD family efflux transporter periplasmic adaptor subunit [Burkholderiales bacterium]|nr:HlyD family efflux transporter periplasmic adaptor subunit [Burkholderiales bacterium]